MKYMLIFGTTAAQQELESAPEEVRNQGYEKIGQWFGSNADRLVATHELQGPQTAKTVRFTNGKPVVMDGPFIEAKEVVGGYAIFDVADEAAALELARTWPAQGTVEIRPVVER
jgi:hypothetical protein